MTKNSHTHNSTSSAFPRDHHLICVRSALYTFTILSKRIFKTKNKNNVKTCTQGSGFNKVYHLYCFIKDTLKCNWHFFFFFLKQVVCSGEEYSIVQFGVICLDSSNGTSTFFPHFFCTISTNVNIVKQQTMSQYY